MAEQSAVNREVVGSNPTSGAKLWCLAEVAELADAQDLKSCGLRESCRFDPGLRHQKKG